MKYLQNIPAFKFSVFLITGILIGTEIYAGLVLPAILITIIILIVSLIYKKNGSVSFILTAFLIIVFGIFKSNIDNIDNFVISDNSVKYLPETKPKAFVKLKGIIKELPDYDSLKIRLQIKAEALYTFKDTAIIEGDVDVTIRENKYSKIKLSQPVLKVGDEIILKGKLQEASGIRNPGEFNYKKYLSLHNIYKIFSVTGYENAKVISSGNLSYLYQKIIFPCKLFALNNIDRYIKGDGASYLKGLVTGERSDISDEMKTAFIDAGVMHLIAVSGLNVAYIILSVTLFLAILRIPVFPRTISTIIILIFYCLFTGSPPSIVRATIMGILILTATLIERRINFYNVIGIAAIIILVADSKQLFDAGFVLSFAAVISMVFIYNLFEKLFLHKLNDSEFKGKKYILGAALLFFTTLAAQLGTMPITSNYFGKISFVSLIANVVVVPVANLSLAVGFFQILTAIFSDTLSSVIAEANNLLLTGQLYFIKWCASVKYAYINIRSFDIMKIILYYFILTFLLTIKNKNDFIKRIIICLLMISMYILSTFDFKKELKVTFLDIGQGDCALIQTPDDKTILIDCGLMNENYNSGKRTIAPYFLRNGIDKIDILILTHLHNDHIGGVNFLLNNYKIGKIIESGQKIETPFTYTMDSLIRIKKIPREIVRSGDITNDLKDMRMYFLFPDNRFLDKEGNTYENNLNNGSVAFILKYKELEIFFTGDIEKEAERFLNDNYSDILKTDILKVAHHGSITSSTIPFVIKNKPDIAVISCGMHNKFNHPSDIILNRFKNIGSQIYRTDLDGAVVIKSDGYTIDVVDWK